MVASPELVCWDSCTWISLISKEKTYTESGAVECDRERLCKNVILQAEKGTLQIAVSAHCLAEVVVDGLDAYLDNEWFIVVNVDKQVGIIARDLMKKGFVPKLKPMDAVHVATALVANTKALHTFDKKLLNLDNKIDMPSGSKLRICHPSLPGKEPPMLTQMRS